MLKSVELTNFKAFQHLPEFAIAPITVLCGANSSGKSSLLQSILLWKQTLESKSLDQTLLLNGRLVHLGSFSNIVYGKAAPRSIILRCVLQFTAAQLRIATKSRSSVPVNYMLDELFSRGPGQRTPQSTHEPIYNVDYSVTLQGDRTIEAAASAVKISAARLETWINQPNGSQDQGIIVELTSDEAERYHLRWDHIASRRGSSAYSSSGTSDHVVVRSVGLIPRFAVQTPSAEDEERLFEVFSAYYRLNTLLTAAFGSLSYIGPLRDEPARRYIYEDEVVEIGVKGENAPYLYVAEGEKELCNHWFLDSAADSFVKVPSCRLRDAASRWLEAIGVAGFDVAQTSEIIRLLADSGCREGPKVNIADVGFGVSQIFPIILEGLRLPVGHTLILEQPEIHLHPELQMRLADYLVCLALAGKKVVVETHSDHLVNRFVRRIVEDTTGHLSDIARLYFFTREAGVSAAELVQVDPCHGITNWPRGFFDQTATEQERIIRASLSRRASARKAGAQ